MQSSLTILHILMLQYVTVYFPLLNYPSEICTLHFSVYKQFISPIYIQNFAKI